MGFQLHDNTFIHSELQVWQVLHSKHGVMTGANFEASDMKLVSILAKVEDKCRK